MGLPEIADFARNFAVMVRVQGPDPKGLKMRKHAFHHYQSGKTTLSASGMLLPDFLHKMQAYDQNGQGRMPNSALAITVASVVEPFLSLQQREKVSQAPPELIPGVHIDVMVEDKRKVESDPIELEERATCWVSAQLLSLADVSEASRALHSLVEASSGSSEHSWEVGWSLASYGNDPQALPYTNFIRPQRASAVEELGYSSLLIKSTTRVAILQVPLISCKDLPSLVISPLNNRGDVILAAGSPFGVLSPGHFYNSVSVGFIANCYPSSSSSRSLLMADIRCLPGMEGAPVFGEDGHLVGILTRPLRQKYSGAEVQLVIPWEPIASACTDLLQKEHRNEGNETSINNRIINAVGMMPSCIEKAMASICLVTVGGGIWASGIVLNNKGLILTNAHLLEPWRYGRTNVNYGRTETNSDAISIPCEESVSPLDEGVVIQQKGQSLLSNVPKLAESSEIEDHRKYNYGASRSGHRNIRVRLDHIDPWIWCDAMVVYISQGPLDIALLQLDFVPDKLCPIVMDFACPSPGSNVYVIGHGLFGPRSDIPPSVCAGVVAKVVKTKTLHSGQSNALEEIPVMLETTAAVHPGGSGGAIVNSDGHMIGLVTSNARHGGGMVIPHLNFSIPCAVLEPIFHFSKDMNDLSILQYLDKPNEQLSSVWALMPPLSPKPGPSVPHLPLQEDGNREGKGSRFAKFMAEKHDVFKRATHLGRVERRSSDLISSKL